MRQEFYRLSCRTRIIRLNLSNTIPKKKIYLAKSEIPVMDNEKLLTLDKNPLEITESIIFTNEIH